MIYYKNGWHIANEDIRYTNTEDGVVEEIIQPVGQEGHDWWLAFEERWDHMDIVEFTPREEPTAAQLERLAEVNEVLKKEGYHGYVEDYVFNGVFPEEIDHPLTAIQNKHTRLELEELKKAFAAMNV